MLSTQQDGDYGTYDVKLLTWMTPATMMMMLNRHRISSGVRVKFSHLGSALVLRRRDRVRERQESCPAGV